MSEPRRADETTRHPSASLTDVGAGTPARGSVDGVHASGGPAVVLATYDERENIRRLLPQLVTLVPAPRIVVVDDNSPDGTADAVRQIADAHPGRIELIERPTKAGYGTALIAGFERALALGADRIVSMDADFSHDPKAVPSLLAALDEADVVVGSRYVNGVRVLNWDVGRLLLSIAANRYVNLLLRLGVSDCTSGFRAYRREVLQRLPLARARSNGYAFLVEILHMVVRGGFRVCEVPIVFEERRRGQSKMDRSVVLEAIWKPWSLLVHPAAPLRNEPRGD